MGYIYLASPYSDPDPAIRVKRFRAACQAAAKLILDGNKVFSPIAHGHAIASFAAPEDDMMRSWDDWKELDLAILEQADVVAILMLPGWRKSVGVQAELDHAIGLYKPILYLREGGFIDV